ncbi:MAG: GIY-YIG nuclease family protein [Clostridia bacterium]|nr:GIY-YIG nuclease family protein [Clostridia bacterium]
MYYTYMLRCADNSIYTGMTNNLEKRINEHLSKGKNGAKYTKSHDGIKLEAAWKSKEKSLACKLEYQIKHINKRQKENLILGEKLSCYLKGKIDCRRYRRVNIEAI